MQVKTGIYKISEIKPYAKNAKKHPDKQLKQIANSLREFGWQQPIVVDKNGVIIVGHGRAEAYKKYPEGIAEPRIEVANLTEEQAKAYRLADNKLNESDWDMDLAVEELRELSADMQALTGFDLDLLIEPDEKDDEVPAIPEEPQSRLGDLYELGNHRVLCGDSTKLEDVERLMNGKKADMVFTDPPYGMNLDVGLSSADVVVDKNWKGWKGKKKNYTAVIADDEDFDPQSYLEFFRETKEQFWWGADYYAERIPNKNDGSWFVWNKTRNSEEDKQVGSRGSQFELCWSKQKHTREVVNTLWRGLMGTESQDIRSRMHPTQKPIQVCDWFITKYSPEDSVVADLFLGSGSTLIAAEKTGRICYGMELDPKYVDVIVERYCEYTRNRDIKKNGEKIVWKKEK